MVRQVVGKVMFVTVCIAAILMIVLQPYNRLSGQQPIVADASATQGGGEVATTPPSDEDIAAAACLAEPQEGQAPSTCGDQLSPEELANIEFTSINAPSEAPVGVTRPLAKKNTGPFSETTADSNRLEVPTSTWTYGSAPTAAGMLFAYFDRNGYPDMYTGASNGGVCPLTNVGQGVGTPIAGSCSIIATQNGFDGQETNGHVDDYWFSAGYSGLDPWEANGVSHNWNGCVADFMGSNQWQWSLGTNGVLDSNVDGGTVLYSNGGAKLYDFVSPSSFGQPQTELCHGLRLFAESRGYSVLENYTQGIDAQYVDGFTFAEFQNEIDAGNPVLIHLANGANALTVVGVGYKSDGTVLLNDTWDNLVHTMAWGGDYAGYTQLAVSVIHLDPSQNDSNKGTTPVVLSVTSSRTNATYGIGQVIPIQVTFDQAVVYTPGTGAAQLLMETGPVDTQATYVSGSGTTVLTFNYVVVAGNNSADLEYQSTSALTLSPDATIQGLGLDANLTLPALGTGNSLAGSKAIVIDTTAPTIVSVSSSLANGTYTTGQVVPIQVTFSQGVTYVPGTGLARIQLETGAADQIALYASGSGAVHTFNYTIVAGDASLDLEYLNTSALTLTGTATLKDIAGNSAVLTLPALGTASSLGGSKAIVIDTAVPTVVSVTSTRANATYGIGQIIPITVKFSKNITYVAGGGLAQIQLATGAVNAQAPYISGSGTSTLTFNYTVVAGDNSSDLEYLSTSALTLTGAATLKDAGGVDATLTLPALGTANSLAGSKAIVIDTTPPTVLNVTSTIANGAYTTGQVIPVKVTFNQSVVYTPGTGLAQIQLETGATDRVVTYSSGGGTASLIFNYTVQAGDSTADLEYLSTSALVLTGTATLKDIAANTAVLTLPALGTANSLAGSKAIVIDTTTPAVVSVTSSLADGTYSAGQVVPVQVTFSKPITYTAGTGVAQLQLETGAVDRQANYASGSGTTTLTFNYTVGSGDTTADLEYISTSALTLTGSAALKDAGAVSAVLTLPTLGSPNSLGGSKNIAIDATAPTVVSVTSSLANGTYTTGQVVPVQVTFSKPVTYLAGTGVAQIQLETGVTDRQATYASGSGTTTLTFNYTVVSGDSTSDLQYLSTSALTLTGTASIKDTAAISAVLTLPALASASSLGGSKAIVIDSAPTVLSVTSSLANGTYTVGQVIPVQVTFSQPVNYLAGTGQGQIQLETGATDRLAVYASGTGTATLTFNYTVVAGDSSLDLEYLSTGALTVTGTASIRNTAGSSAVLTLPALATVNSLGGSKAIVVNTTPATVVSVTSSLANGSYTAGQVVPVQVTFSKPVNYLAGTGQAQLQLETGTTDRLAVYASGTGTAILTFNYTIVAADISADLEYLSTGALTLTGSASLLDAGGAPAVLTLPALASANSLGGSKAIVIDTTAPTVLSVTSSLANGTYGIGQVIPVQVNFSKAVTYAAGSGQAQLQLETGVTDRQAPYASGSGTTALTFNYTVTAGDISADLEYLSISALALTGTATIKDAGSVDAVLALPALATASSLSGSKAIVIDTTVPTVLSVTSTRANATYGIGQIIPITVQFSKSVNYVAGGGLAQILVETGVTDRQATYISGSGTAVLTFNYTVQAGDNTADLQYQSVNALTVSGGATIKDVGGNNAVLTLPALASASSLAGSKAIVIDTTAPTVLNVTSTLADGTYTTGQVVPVRVTFNQSVTYVAGTGAAQLQLETGTTDRVAVYASGSGTAALIFNYTVVAGDTSADLEYLSTAALTLTGTATLRDVALNNAVLTLPTLGSVNSLGGSKAIVIDTLPATVLNVTSSLANGTYSAGQVVPIQVTFSKLITYTAGTGVAQLQLETGATDRQATYASGNGTATLTFNYTVVAGDTSADLEYISTAALTLTGSATLRDASAANAVLTLPTLGSANSLGGSKAIVIDTAPPTVVSVTSSLANGSYVAGQVVPVQVTFNKVVNYVPGTGLAQIQLETGSTDRQATYSGGTGTATLTFNYTVVLGDTSLDLEYLSTTALTLTGTATIKDAAAISAVLTLPALGSPNSLGGSKAIVIDTAPTVVSVTSSLADGTYTTGQVVPVQVTFNKVVNYLPGTGLAQIQLETGATDRQATYSGGTGTATLTFNYTVVAGDVSADLQYVSTSALALTGTASIRDAGLNNAILTLPTLASATSLGGSKAIVIDTTAPTVVSVSSSLANGTYTTGQVVPVAVTFNKVVDYLPGDGDARLQLETGTTDQQALYSSGTGTTTLIFDYTVVAGDASADLQYLSTTALTLTGTTSSIKDVGGTSATLTLPALASANSLAGGKAIVINTAPPTVANVSSSLANGTYTIGQVVPVVVTFNKVVNYLPGTGAAQIQLETGATDRLAVYASGSGTTALTFNYTVVAGDTSNDLQYLNTGALTLTLDATIKDEAGASAVLTLPALGSANSLGGSKAIKIDTTAPTVTSVTSTLANGTYTVGQVIPVKVVFSEVVTYTPGAGSAQIQLETGTTDRIATYASGSGTTGLVFNYTVVAGDASADLQYLSTTALTLTAPATIKDAAGFDAALTLPALASASSLAGGKAIVVDTTIPTVMNVTSTKANGSYGVGVLIPVTVKFTKPVTYVPGTGTLQIQLETGATDRLATYASGSGTATLTFNYTVVAGDASLDLDYLSTTALTITGTATLKDAAGTSADLTLPALGSASSIAGSKAISIDTAQPTVVSVTSTLADGTYGAGQIVPVKVNFSDVVNYTVGTGVAQIQLETGSTDRLAAYASGTGTSSLVFNYIVVAGDTSADLEYLDTAALTLTGTASIKDAAGNLAILTLPVLATANSLAGGKNIAIDTAAPVVSSVTSSLPDGSYTAGQVVPIQVVFNKAVTYTPGAGSAQIQLETGTTDRQAGYSSGSGTTTLNFNYTIVAGDASSDLNYLSTTSLAVTGGATIRDSGALDAVLTLPALVSATSLAGSKAIVIDTTPPTVLSVTSSLANGSYTVGQVVPVLVTFSKPVTYVPNTGVARVQLETGSTDRYATFSGGSGTNTLTFNYTVVATDTASDLDYLSTAALTLTNDAVIRDAGTVNAVLTLPAVGSGNSLGGSKAIVIDTTAPTVLSVTSSLANGSYTVGQVVPIQVTFSETVNYLAGSGVAQLQLETGTTDRQVAYTSGTGTAVLTFNYTVSATDTTTDLQYLNTTALTLTGTASLSDAALNTATLTLPALATASSLGGSKAIVIDTTVPTVVSVTSSLANGTYTIGQSVPIQVTFSEAITYVAGGGVAQLQLETGTTDRQALYASGTGTTVLTFNYTVVAGDSTSNLESLSTSALTLTGGATLRDTATNDATLTLPNLGSANSLGGSKIIVIDAIVPTVLSVTSSLANGTYTTGQVVPVQVTFSEPVTYVQGTGLAQLQLETGATDRQAPCVSGSGTAILTFNYTIVATDATLDLEYLSTTALGLTGSAVIRDAINNANRTLPALASANSLGGSKAIVIDTTAPTVVSVTSSLANGSYTVGQVVPVEVTFSEPVTYTPNAGSAQIQLETGTTDRMATYVSGSGTTTLVFNYTVVAGDVSPDLQYLATTSLTATGGATIRDAININATLTLPALASVSSLGGSKAIVIF